MQQSDKKILGYVRVSSVGQVTDGESLPRQIDKIRAYCELKELPEPEILADEGVSGFKSNREGFQKLVALCQSKQVRTVVVYDLSRLSRSVRGTLEFIDDVITKNQIEFVSLQNDIDTSTPAGKAFLTMSAVFNQLYRDEIAFKTKEALSHKQKKLEKTGGTVPFGYSLVDGFKLTPNKDEVETVQFIHQLRKQDLSLREIIGELKAKGIKTKTGNATWSPEVVRGILNKQIHQICMSSLRNKHKDRLLEDVVGALYSTEDAIKDPKLSALGRRVTKVAQLG